MVLSQSTVFYLFYLSVNCRLSSQIYLVFIFILFAGTVDARAFLNNLSMGDDKVKLNNIMYNIICEYNYNHCRLCLKNIGGKFIHFQDIFPLGTESDDFWSMKDILFHCLGLESEVCN